MELHLMTEDMSELRSERPSEAIEFSDSDFVNAPLHDTSMKIPGGGLVSTAEDLVRFANATMEAKLLKRGTVEQMWTDGRTKSGASTMPTNTFAAVESPTTPPTFIAFSSRKEIARTRAGSTRQ
jgi:hypothetical protein